jgi:probable phosphoglycerate mutase
LRHAETDLNEAGIITGALDVGINAAGRMRLRQLGDVFERERWSHVFSSPARRCTETLSELLKEDSSAIQIRDELRERSMGELEGFSKFEYHDSLPQYRGVDLLSSFHASSVGGEAYCDVFRRVVTFIETIVNDVLRGSRTLVCTHDTVIRMVVMLLENLSIEDAVQLEVNNAEPFYYAPRS